MRTRDGRSVQEVQQTHFHLAKEASVLEASALEDKGQFHTPNTDIPDLSGVNEVAGCCQ